MTRGSKSSTPPPAVAAEISSGNRPLKDYIIHGTVVHGNHLGRTLGFPTANIRPTEDLPPFIPNGVYLAEVILYERKFFGLCNIGYRPTIDGKHFVIEVNILDFSEDIYGNTITVKILKAIRKEKKFKNLDLLVVQIKKDKVKALKYLSTLNKNKAG